MKLTRERHIPEETLCSQCRRGAAWIFTDGGEEHVQITCPDCGSVEMTRFDFESTEIDMVQVSDPGE